MRVHVSVYKKCTPPLPTHSRSNKDGNNRVFQFWFLLCQLNEQFRDQSHMAKTVCGTPAIQLVTLEEGGEEEEEERVEEWRRRRVCSTYTLLIFSMCFL